MKIPLIMDPAVSEKPVVYLAPMQGFTNSIFRQSFCGVVGAPEAMFAPFINSHRIDHRSFRDVLPQENKGYLLIPQVLGNNASEILSVVERLQRMGYSEINWNLGCPHPMVTGKKLGAGLLPFPALVDQILEQIFHHESLKFSVKIRLGFINDDDWKALVPVLNRYPFTEIIIHGRTARQMYKGEVNTEAFQAFALALKHPVCYNGDITNFDQFVRLSGRLPFVSRWMIGRGLISNPLLMKEIKSGLAVSPSQVHRAILKIHERLWSLNQERLSGMSHLLFRMKPYWDYWGKSFPGHDKILKKLMKARNIDSYLLACDELFGEVVGRNGR